MTLTYIQSGKLQLKADAASHNLTARNEWPDFHIFDSIDDVQQIATEWL
ncbi:hypothetical protein [Pseudooceanicola atlanticus]|nr:hypothetical protein [Pseudooceanicola atlanticus]